MFALLLVIQTPALPIRHTIWHSFWLFASLFLFPLAGYFQLGIRCLLSPQQRLHWSNMNGANCPLPVRLFLAERHSVATFSLIVTVALCSSSTKGRQTDVGHRTQDTGHRTQDTVSGFASAETAVTGSVSTVARLSFSDSHYSLEFIFSLIGVH